jgi:hypothetical protein
MCDSEPVTTDPGLYSVVFENRRVRVALSRHPGDRTSLHFNPDR